MLRTYVSILGKGAGPLRGLKIREGTYVVLGGDNVLPLVEIGLTDLPNVHRFFFLLKLIITNKKIDLYSEHSNLL